MNYTKNMMLYEVTGNEEYLEEARSTMYGLVPSDLSKNSYSRFYRATPYLEKPYVVAFLKETDPRERSEILKVVPQDVGEVLRTKWSKMDGLYNNEEYSRAAVQPMPQADWAGWSPDVDLSDIELKTVEQRGLQAHDFGLGWVTQRRRIANSAGIPGPIDIKDPVGSTSGYRNESMTINQSEVRRMVENVLSRMGVDGFITISPSYTDNVLTVVA